MAAEEPLQILINGEPLSVVMRTPGSDLELALGLLWSERVITDLGQVTRILISAEAAETEGHLNVAGELVESNLIDLHLAGAVHLPERSFLASSACGVCGATTIESLALDFPPLPDGPVLPASLTTPDRPAAAGLADAGAAAPGRDRPAGGGPDRLPGVAEMSLRRLPQRVDCTVESAMAQIESRASPPARYAKRRRIIEGRLMKNGSIQ